MKPFSDFLNWLSPEQVSAIIDDANQKAINTAKAMSFSNPAFFGNQIGAVAYTIAIELLGAYHCWLNLEEES